MDCDSDVLLESSQAFLKTLVGESNWSRWVVLRGQSDAHNLHAFISFLLDAGETQLHPDASSLVSGVDVDNNGGVNVCGSQSTPLQGGVGGAQYGQEPLAHHSPGLGGVKSGVKAVSELKQRQHSHRAAPYDLATVSTHSDIVDMEAAGGDIHDMYSSTPLDPVVANSLVFGDSNYSDSAFYCNRCNIHVTKVDGAMMHLSKVHPTDGIMVKCLYCQQLYESGDQFLVTHGADCVWRLTCPHCNKAFASKYNLKSHVAKHQKGEQSQQSITPRTHE